MPVSIGQARDILRRQSGGEAPELLAHRLAPVSPEERAIPASVPKPLAWAAEARDERIAFLEARGFPLPHLAGRAPQADPAALQGNIEQFIGMTQIPTGLIGPLRVNGLHASGDFYVPLATSEGALVASYNRGARVITRAGGASCLTTVAHVQRAPGFVFGSIAEAGRFAAWASGEFDHFRDVAASRTRHGALTGLHVHMETRTVYLIFSYHTG